MGMVLEPVAGDGLVGKGVGGLGGFQWQVHPLRLHGHTGRGGCPGTLSTGVQLINKRRRESLKPS